MKKTSRASLRRRILIPLFGALALLLIVGCELPNAAQLASYQGLGIRVSRIELQHSPNQVGVRTAFFCALADHTKNSVTIQKYKIFYARDNRTVFQESAWIPRVRTVTQHVGHCPPAAVMPAGFSHGWVGVAFSGVDEDGKQVIGYNHLYFPKGSLDQPGARVSANF